MTDRDEAVALLMGIGERRRALKEQEGVLRTDTKSALRASFGHVSRAEAARLTGLNRSTIYELYLGDENEPAHDRAGASEHHSSGAGQPASAGAPG